MRGLDLLDLVALAAEVSEVEASKLLELLDTGEVATLLAEARPPLPPHEGAATLLVGVIAIGPLPAGNRRLALLAATQLLAANGLVADLDAVDTRDLLAAIEADVEDVSSVAAWLDGRVSAQDPLSGALRALLAADAWRAIALALDRARRHRRIRVTPADLLLGLFREGDGPAAKALGAEAPAAPAPGAPPRLSLPGDRPAFEPDVRSVLELALRAATTLGHREIGGGHLLLGLLDAGHADVLPDGLDPAEVRGRVLALLDIGRSALPDGDLSWLVQRAADRLRSGDPVAAAELDEVAARQRAGLDRLVAMIRAWRGEVFLDALAGDQAIVRLLGAHRLGAPDVETGEQRRLATYLDEIGRYPRLSRSEEAELAESIRTGTPPRAAQARRRLIESHLQLVVGVARAYEGSGLSMLDLLQEGNLGLLDAAERFDPTRGYRFATLATSCIRQAIVAAVARLPHVPPDASR